MITSTDATAPVATVAATGVATEGELRSRGASSSSRNNPQSGDDDDNNDDDATTSCQKTRGWFTLRTSRLGILQKYKSQICGGLLLLILVTIVLVLSIEDVGIVSDYIEYDIYIYSLPSLDLAERFEIGREMYKERM